MFKIDEKTKSQTAEQARFVTWDSRKTAKLIDLRLKNEQFDELQQSDLQRLLASEKAFLDEKHVPKDNKCYACGTILKVGQEVEHVRHNPWTAKIDAVLSRENIYPLQIKELEAETNPYSIELKDHQTEIAELSLQKTVLEVKRGDITLLQADITLLQDIVQDYRSTSIINTINYVETQTNKLLTDHFDAELRVKFDVSSADKLEISLYKDGNTAVYTQLSKGQRCLLKLCFGLAVMQAVQNHAGVKFEQIFCDEALDGLDDALKLKAYGLFEMLSQDYNSIFVVEHNEALKTMFPNSYSVKLENGKSTIEKL
jgi:DNA repair exonuclease SbcCD ATPase subunit